MKTSEETGSGKRNWKAWVASSLVSGVVLVGVRVWIHSIKNEPPDRTDSVRSQMEELERSRSAATSKIIEEAIEKSIQKQSAENESESIANTQLPAESEPNPVSNAAAPNSLELDGFNFPNTSAPVEPLKVTGWWLPVEPGSKQGTVIADVELEKGWRIPPLTESPIGRTSFELAGSVQQISEWNAGTTPQREYSKAADAEIFYHPGRVLFFTSAKLNSLPSGVRGEIFSTPFGETEARLSEESFNLQTIHRDGLTVFPYSQSLFETLLESDHRVLVLVRAGWSFESQIDEKLLQSENVVKALRENSTVVLSADVTTGKGESTDFLKSLEDKHTIPQRILFDGRKELWRSVGELSLRDDSRFIEFLNGPARE